MGLSSSWSAAVASTVCCAVVRSEKMPSPSVPESDVPCPEIDGRVDYVAALPDECLACVFHSLGSEDKKQCSLVCRRWLKVEGQNHHRLSLNVHGDILGVIPSLFSRFDSVTKLALRCDRRSVSLNDEALIRISIRCRNLTRLKLRGCRELTDHGMVSLSQNCKGLKKLSSSSCTFGSKGLNAVLNHCSVLEELSVKRLRGINDEGAAAEGIGPGIAASSLKILCLKELYNGQCFEPLLIGSKKLRTLKLIRCLGDWDKLLRIMGNGNPNLVEVHLERLQLSDIGLSAMASCSNLEILHLVKTPECTSFGLACLVECCRLLRKLHIDGWRTNKIGDEGLIAVSKQCPNLQELVLIGVNPTSWSLAALASNCQNLERLALCGSDTFGDPEISCIAEKCMALRKLCIKGCPISDDGLTVLAWGCPKLEKVKVKKCKNVTGEVAEWLKEHRSSLAVNLDFDGIEPMDGNGSDSGIQDDATDVPPLVSQVAAAADAPSSSNNRLSMLKSKFGFLAGRNLIACTFRRFSKSNDRANANA